MSEWDGEGLPPVGMRVEAFVHVDSLPEWKEVEVLKHLHGECAVMLDDTSLYWADRFRPIKSERDKVVDAIADAIDRWHGNCNGDQALPEAIYDSELFDIRLREEG